MILLAKNEKKKKLAKSRADSPGLHADDYKDVYENLSDELHYGEVKSGGTTIEEVRHYHKSNNNYFFL